MLIFLLLKVEKSVFTCIFSSTESLFASLANSVLRLD